MELSIAWEWVKAHPQRLLGFLQVTLSQVAMWDFVPAKVALAVSSVAGLFQVWTAFLNSPSKEEKTQ